MGKKRLWEQQKQKRWIMSNLIRKYKGRCVSCDIPVSKRFTEPLEDSYGTIDHIVSLSNGGTDNLNNLALMCYKCNMAKGNKSHEEFMKELLEANENQ
jgi:5-methylcytosine-specific restriction endonuclease McrA